MFVLEVHGMCVLGGLGSLCEGRPNLLPIVRELCCISLRDCWASSHVSARPNP
jgi:hypothetical protein